MREREKGRGKVRYNCLSHSYSEVLGTFFFKTSVARSVERETSNRKISGTKPGIVNSIFLCKTFFPMYVLHMCGSTKLVYAKGQLFSKGLIEIFI